MPACHPSLAVVVQHRGLVMHGQTQLPRQFEHSWHGGWLHSGGGYPEIGFELTAEEEV